jgi:hypothetical protein
MMFMSTAQNKFKLSTQLEIHQFIVQNPPPPPKKKNVRNELISLVPYDTWHLTAAIHYDAIMASKQKCLLCITFIMSESREQCKGIKFYAELKLGTQIMT